MFPPAVQQVMDEVNALREQVDDHWQIPRDEAELLAQLVRLGRCESICEVGVSYGYSTLHLAAAAREQGGHVHAIDISEKKVDAAAQHLAQAGLTDVVTLHLGDAREMLASIQPTKPFDFVFIDAIKEQSFEYLAAVQPKLAPRAAIVTDNTVTHAQELSSFVQHLRALAGAHSTNVAVGNGFELTILENAPRS